MVILQSAANLFIRMHLFISITLYTCDYYSPWFNHSYEECAETLCYDAIKAALLIDADSIDANQALVSLRLSQSNPEEASLIIELIYARVKQIRDKARERTIIDELIGVEDVDSDGE